MSLMQVIFTNKLVYRILIIVHYNGINARKYVIMTMFQSHQYLQKVQG